MEDILTCKYKNCHKYYLDPVILPCSKNLCRNHLEEILNESNSTFDCYFCFKKHEISSDGLILNEDLDSIVKLKFHLNEKEKEALELIKNLQDSINDLRVINESPDLFIFEYVSNVRNQIDIVRENLIERINQISDDMINRLNAYENECKENLKNLNDLIDQNKELIHEIEVQCFDLKNEMRTPKKNEKRLDQLAFHINDRLIENKNRTMNFKNSLLNDKGCYFKSANFAAQFNESLFGTFKLEESYNIKIAEQLNNSELLNSSILSTTESISLLKLCGFSSTEKFTLLYKASVDGFGANDFHRKCDGVAKTLTLIKTNDNKTVFGGYTNSEWDSLNKFKEDCNSFVFSLINKYNQPIKMGIYRTEHKFAIGCDRKYGPWFGEEPDLRIVSDSNKNYGSNLNLGYSYSNQEYPNTEFPLPYRIELESFLTSEIEVYKLD